MVCQNFALLLTPTGETALFLAAKAGRMEFVISLVLHGADVDYLVPADGRTALHGTLLMHVL